MEHIVILQHLNGQYSSHSLFGILFHQESSEEENVTEKITNGGRVIQQNSLEKLTEADLEADIESNPGGRASDTVVLSDDDGLEYKKTLRLTSDQWESLNLKLGKNKVTFTVTTRYQVWIEKMNWIFFSNLRYFKGSRWQFVKGLFSCYSIIP